MHTCDFQTGFSASRNAHLFLEPSLGLPRFEKNKPWLDKKGANSYSKIKRVKGFRQANRELIWNFYLRLKYCKTN